ncbi:hypothetical protein, partial [Flavobacterium enshiense]
AGGTLAASLKKNNVKKENITTSVNIQKLQLDSFEKINYFKVPALCLFFSVMSITNGFQQFSVINFAEPLPKLSLIFFILGLVSFKLKSDRLKLIIVENPASDFKEKILSLAQQSKWETEKNEEKVMIFKTIPPRDYDDFYNHNKNHGERIYIFAEQNRVYLKSIDNLDSPGFKIQKGDNLSNEKAIVVTIKPAANSGFML